MYSVNMPSMDSVARFKAAMDSGAYGGKVSGAGGGGFMFFVCQYDKKHLVAKEVQKLGAKVVDFAFEPLGARSWRATI